MGNVNRTGKSINGVTVVTNANRALVKCLSIRRPESRLIVYGCNFTSPTGMKKASWVFSQDAFSFFIPVWFTHHRRPRMLPLTDAAILRFLQHFSTTRRCFASLVVVYSSSYFQYITLFDPFIVHLTKKIIQSQKIFRKVIPDFLQRSKSLSRTLSSRVVCAVGAGRSRPYFVGSI